MDEEITSRILNSNNEVLGMNGVIFVPHNEVSNLNIYVPSLAECVCCIIKGESGFLMAHFSVQSSKGMLNDLLKQYFLQHNMFYAEE